MIETNEGIVGFGEAHIVGKTHTVREYLRDIRRHIIGHDVFDIEALYEKITLLDFGAPGQVAMTGLALVEMACWDCIGKKLRQPVYKLIGGAVRTEIPAYANGWYTVERTPEAFHAAARRVVERGYRGLKFDPFGNGNMELDVYKRQTFHCVNGAEEKFKAAYPVHYVAEADQVADTVIFLASRAVDYINGVNLPIDGGLTAHTGQPPMGKY